VGSFHAPARSTFEPANLKVGLIQTRHITTKGGAHQQTSERAAPPVSVEEKEKATGDKRKMLLFLLMSIQYLN
jgi:hypothetical protein